MITPILENLIHEGRAAFKTFNGAAAGSMRLQIPEKNYIVITDVYIEGFLDTENARESAPTEDCVNWRLWVRSEGVYGFSLLHRNHYIFCPDPTPPGTSLLAKALNRNHYNVYSIQSGLLKISLGRILPVSGWVVNDFSQAPAISEEENTTQGYGINPTGSNTLRNVQIPGIGPVPNAQYNPLTERISPTPGANKTTIEQFIPPMLPLNNIGLGQAGQNDYYPMITMSYVQVFEELPPIIKK